jgi:hypothetical protein
VSFDLYLWASPSPVTADQAERICHRLAEGDQFATTPSPRIFEFAGELIERYPCLEDLDLASLEDSPWRMSPDVSSDIVLRLDSCDGSEAIGPDAGEIERQVRRLSPANWYIVLEREESTYVQAGLGPDADAPEGRYALEYREGSPERHYRALVDNLDDIAAAFTGFASGEDGWKSARGWTRF